MEPVTRLPQTPLLDPLETKSAAPQDVTPWGLIVTTHDPAVVFRHSGWQRTRVQVYAALQAANVGPRRLRAFALCGSDPWLVQSADDPADFKIRMNTCHSRWCVPCNAARAHTIAANLQAKISDRTHYFVTLTLKHSDTPLSDQLDRIYASFRDLRSREYWRTRVFGGGAVLEIKFSVRSQQWHPHLHIFCHGRGLERFPLSDQWFRVTGDSFIVDVDTIRDSRDVTRYVTKYVTKPVPHPIVKRQPLLLEMIQALHRRRSVLTFGDWRGYRLSKPLDATVWHECCPLDELFSRVQRGDALAIAQLRRLAVKYPQFMSAVGPDPPGDPFVA